MASTQGDNRVFVAGASGAVGRPLCRLLVQDEWQVWGTTRADEKSAALRALGITPVVVDVYDEERLRSVVAAARPAIVIHQLTDLPPALDPARMPEAVARNARLREVGTRNLVAAAAACGVNRMIAQSIAFAYAPGPKPWPEDAPLNLDDPASGRTARAVASLERQVLGGPFTGVVLRYGRLYGPGTGFDRPSPNGAPVHVDAAADAARRALVRGAGIYNIAEEDGIVSSRRAMADLGWDPRFRSA
jgi:nucleoside-diphosphate-sugar epimerase